MIIDEDLLRDMGACEDGIATFLEVFEDGVMDTSDPYDMLAMFDNGWLSRDAAWFLGEIDDDDLYEFTFKTMTINNLDLYNLNSMLIKFDDCALNRPCVFVYQGIDQIKFANTKIIGGEFESYSSFFMCEFDNVEFIDCNFGEGVVFHHCIIKNTVGLPEARFENCEVDDCEHEVSPC